MSDTRKRDLLIDPLWPDITFVMRTTQQLLPRTQRWSKYVVEGYARPQNDLQHSYSILILVWDVLSRNEGKSSIELDIPLLLQAFYIHDLGEALSGRDVLYIDRQAEQEVEEYVRFCEHMRHLDPKTFAAFERAFLLQFCLRSSDVLEAFSLHAQEIMSSLAETRRNESLLFNAIERWDYVIYAFEQYEIYGNLKILIQTLRHQMPHLERLTEELSSAVPIFGDEIWTAMIRDRCSHLLANYAGQWIEQKGEYRATPE